MVTVGASPAASAVGVATVPTNTVVRPTAAAQINGRRSTAAALRTVVRLKNTPAFMSPYPVGSGTLQDQVCAQRPAEQLGQRDRIRTR